MRADLTLCVYCKEDLADWEGGVQIVRMPNGRCYFAHPRTASVNGRPGVPLCVEGLHRLSPPPTESNMRSK